MKRLVASVVLLAWLVLGQARPAWAQIAQDTVDYLDPATKKAVKIVGTIKEESPAGIKIEEKKDLKFAPALSIIQVTYRSRVSALDFRQGFTKETRALEATRAETRRTLLQEALTAFQTLAPQLKDGSPNGYRYIQFKVAQIKVHLAQVDPDKPNLMRTALETLKNFKADFPDGWQVVPCLKLMAELYEKQGDIDSARQVFEELVTIKDAPKELREEGDLMIAQMLVRGKKYAEAERKLQTLFAAMPKDDPKRAMVQLYLVEARLVQNKLDQVERELKDALATATDPTVKAAAHNFMGDYFRACKQDDEAFWQYLRVDTLYAQDKAEHAKSLYHLWKLYETVKGNPQRAEQCYDRLLDKTYVDTEFQRRALKDKPAKPDK